jgi:hypothetical protein
MFKSNADNQYYLWYLKRENARDGIAFYDFNKDGRKDFIVGKNVYVGYPRNYSDIYVATSVLGVNEDFMTEVPNEIRLYPCYPNPFNPVATITFSVPASRNVRLTVIDILGKEIAVLLDQIIEKGTHTRTWNAVGKGSGIYFCKLQTRELSTVIKLLLVR